jgi:hypothetical protein
MGVLMTIRVMRKISPLSEHESHILAFGLYKALQNKGMMTETMLDAMITNIRHRIAEMPQSDAAKAAEMEREYQEEQARETRDAEKGPGDSDG